MMSVRWPGLQKKGLFFLMILLVFFAVWCVLRGVSRDQDIPLSKAQCVMAHDCELSFWQVGGRSGIWICRGVECIQRSLAQLPWQGIGIKSQKGRCLTLFLRANHQEEEVSHCF